MTDEGFDIWLDRLKAAFAIEDNEQGFHAVLDEAWEAGPFVARWKNSQNCSDGCCEMEQLVFEEYADKNLAHWATCFGDNAIEPVRSAVLA